MAVFVDVILMYSVYLVELKGSDLFTVKTPAHSLGTHGLRIFLPIVFTHVAFSIVSNFDSSTSMM